MPFLNKILNAHICKLKTVGPSNAAHNLNEAGSDDLQYKLVIQAARSFVRGEC